VSIWPKENLSQLHLPETAKATGQTDCSACFVNRLTCNHAQSIASAHFRPFVHKYLFEHA
jgi:hypothetical protein